MCPPLARDETTKPHERVAIPEERSAMADINLAVVGSAGEGIQVIGAVLAETIGAHGYAVFVWQEYESRIRGGQSRFSLRIGEEPANAPLEQVDLLLALNAGA